MHYLNPLLDPEFEENKNVFPIFFEIDFSKIFRFYTKLNDNGSC